jgi:hypothetical protein
VRVCRPGGTIALASWTPDGFIGCPFKVVGAYAPPPPGFQPPALWGTPERIEQLFGAAAREIATARRDFVFRYRSPAHRLDVFRTFYGPVHKAFAALDAERQAALERAILALLADCNHASDGTLVAPSDYLEAAVAKQ